MFEFSMACITLLAALCICDFVLILLNEQEINSLRTANRRLRHHAYQAWGEAREAQRQLDIITGELKRRRESNG